MYGHNATLQWSLFSLIANQGFNTKSVSVLRTLVLYYKVKLVFNKYGTCLFGIVSSYVIKCTGDTLTEIKILNR